MPCCHINPASPFSVHLQQDSRRFSAYVAGLWPLPPGANGSQMTSALHVDLKLWDPLGRLPNIHNPNHAFDNAWKAARPVLTQDLFLQNPASRPTVRGLIAPPPLAGVQIGGCAIAVFDDWILSAIQQIKGIATGLPGYAAALAAGSPPALSTVGMAQKLVNIYLKYNVCWHAGGIYNPAAQGFVANPAAAFVAPYLCALHCPIDSILLGKIRSLPLGAWMHKRGYMANNSYLYQLNGQALPWSKLDCLGAYYRFQQLLRLLAMRTWPHGCACPPLDGNPHWKIELDDDLRKAIDDTIAQIGNKPSPNTNPQPKRVRQDPLPDQPVTPSVPHDSASEGRTVWAQPQNSGFKSLKWRCGDHWNAGALSFNNRNFDGTCHINSVRSHRGKDLSLAEQIFRNGFDFTKQPGFYPPPKQGGVAGVGGGTGYLGYRTFPDEVAARNYLRSVGIPPQDCC
jgi:hypothetical protein